jgi:hypothetical protein
MKRQTEKYDILPSDRCPCGNILARVQTVCFQCGRPREQKGVR